MTIHIHVGANMPGYLPEGDVMCFDSVEGALDALRQEIKDQQDFYYEGCEAASPEQQEKGSECCGWCDVAGDCEAALGAIADGDTAHVLTSERAAQFRKLQEDGQARPIGIGWIFSPPEGADIHHWLTYIPGDRDDCEIAQEQDA
jgi:hypothetical protein